MMRLIRIAYSDLQVFLYRSNFVRVPSINDNALRIYGNDYRDIITATECL